MSFQEKNNFVIMYIHNSDKYKELFSIYGNSIYFLLDNIKHQNYVFLELKLHKITFDINFLNKVNMANTIKQNENFFIKLKLIIYAEYLIKLYEKSSIEDFDCRSDFFENLEDYISKMSTQLWIHSDEFSDIFIKYLL